LTPGSPPRRSGATRRARVVDPVRSALCEVEAGNERLEQLIGRLIVEGAEFEGLMNSAQELLGEVGKGAATLPGRLLHTSSQFYSEWRAISVQNWAKTCAFRGIIA
jgi:hypothetical protein